MSKDNSKKYENVNSKEYPFFFTMDETIAEELSKQGFTLISDTSKRFMFVNDKPLHFESSDGNIFDEEMRTKICFTNMMCMA